MTSQRISGDPEKLFLAHLETIERAIRFVCRRASLTGQDAEDFASSVKLKLIENDYAIIRKHDPRSSFAAYIAVVVQRLMLDHRIAEWGKWHASAEAKRLGDHAVTIEAMLYRDGRTIEEIVPALLRRWPELTRAAIDDIAKVLPPHARRPRAVDLEHAVETVGDDSMSVHDAAFATDRALLSRQVAAIVRDAMKDFDDHDRLVLRLRFEGGLSVAAISRMLHVEQKPLYRRLQRVLARIRSRLELAGIDAEDANDLLSGGETDFDFGFSGEYSDLRRPAVDKEES